MIKGYNDEDMIFDEETGMYILTPEYVQQKCKINIFERLSQGDFTDPQGICHAILARISSIVYAYIHEFNFSDRQDNIIAGFKSARSIVKQALHQQTVAYFLDGAREIDNLAKCALEKTIPEFGISLIFTGEMPIVGEVES